MSVAQGVELRDGSCVNSRISEKCLSICSKQLIPQNGSIVNVEPRIEGWWASVKNSECSLVGGIVGRQVYL